MTGIGQGSPDMGIALLAVANVVMFVALVVIAARIACRWYVMKNEGLDDWCALLATIIAIGMVVCMGIGVSNGTGKMEYDRSVDEVDLAKIRLATQILYTLSSSFIKISILLLYRRLFPNLRWFIFITIAFLAAMSIAFILAAVFQCNPVSKLFSPLEQDHVVSCFPPLAFWCDVSATFLATDLWIFLLPVWTVIRLQMSRRKKCIVMGLFGLGLFACGAAIARMFYVIKLYAGHDPSWDVVPVYICSVAEIALALIACSVPPLRPALILLVEKMHPKKIGDEESPAGP
ncbi:hypothetical protein FE257_012921 [Aspergillus nanangensis]|uniref:Rhodopsin domain-containing protein n=1 Tax=Aspergillus nanangensis TaxID=2582783 RepID=A0AAD4CF99_ASPNN|nr:hypothetical protein FE257_012921 [Aspergillus nanangensis]